MKTLIYLTLETGITLDLMQDNLFLLTSLSSVISIPWDKTRAFKLAKNEVRYFILEESKKEQQLHEFVATNCSHLLDMDTIDSGIPNDILNMNVPGIQRENPVFCTTTYTKSLTSNMHGKAGCYAFLDKTTGEILYIGSCVDYSSRIYMHYDYLKDLSTIFYKELTKRGGFQTIVLVPLLVSPNRIFQFTTVYGGASLFAISMLRMLTQYEIRLKEQALLTYYRPLLNSDQPVIFSFNKAKLYAPTREGSVPVVVVDSNNTKYSFPSIKQAKAFTGLNESTITRSANCIPNPSWCYSADIELKIHFLIESYPTKSHRASSTDFPNLNYDFNNLPVGAVFFLDEHLNLLKESYKHSFSHALKSIGIFKSKPGKYVNKEFLMYSPVLEKPVYMVFNPATDRVNGLRQRKLKAVDSKGIEPVLHFVSGKDLMNHFNMTRPFNTYISKGMLVNKRYRIYYDDLE